MHSLTMERCLGRMEYMLSPDEKDPLLTQKGRQELWKRIQDMAREIDRQDREINELREELARTRKQFDEYKKRHPEMVGIKNGKAYIASIDSKRDANGTGRKPGAQPGHPPHFRHVPAHIDDSVEVPVDRCPECGCTELGKPSFRTRVVEGIRRPEPYAVEYAIQRRYCRQCGKLVEGSVPDALPGCTIDLQTMLVIVWMRIAHRMTEQSVAEAMGILFGLCISEGEVAGACKLVARAFEPFYRTMLRDIRDAPSRHMDETTWRIDGRSAWMWTFVEKWTTVFVIRYSRGHDVPLEVLGKHAPGVNITDRYRAYDALASQTGDSQQYCWAHILLDAKELSDFYGDEGAEIYGTLCSLYAEAKTYGHHGSVEDEQRLIHALGALDHSYSNEKCSSFVRSLLSATDKLFLFVRMDIDSTNNEAEREIRPMVVRRKVSGGSRSDAGAETTGRLASVIQTLRKRRMDLFTDGAKLMKPSTG